jgi:hypothetical protein
MYTEQHHIVPRSFGGSDDISNLVKLTAREHYVAHLLLWKIRFPSVYGSKMSFAFGTFVNRFKQEYHSSYKITSRIYAQFKKEYSLLMSERMSGEGNHFFGKTHSEETRRIIGEKSKQKIFKKGPENPNWGKKQNLSDEQRKKRSEGSKTRWGNDEFRKKILTSRKLYWESEEGRVRANIWAEGLRGVKLDPERVEKSASKKRGKKGTEIFSEQALANIREANKHRIYSEEGLAKIRESSRKVGQRLKSEEHKKRISESNKGKHNNKGEKNPMFGKKHSPETIAKIKETKRISALKNAKPKFVGPLKPKNMITFRGVNYASIKKASSHFGIPVGKIKTQIKHWGENPDAETIAKIDSGKLKPPMTAWNKGSIGLQVSWNKGMEAPKFTCEHCGKIVGGKTNYIRYHHDNCKLKVFTLLSTKKG